MVSNKYFAVNGNRSCRAAANRDVARPSLHFQIHWPTDSEGLVERALRRGSERRGGNKQRPQRNRREWKARSTHRRTAEISSSIHVASLPKCRSSQKPKPEPDYCSTTWSPSFSPLRTSVFAPFEMPMLTATLSLPSLPFGSGISTEAFLSLS